MEVTQTNKLTAVQTRTSSSRPSRRRWETLAHPKTKTHTQILIYKYGLKGLLAQASLKHVILTVDRCITMLHQYQSPASKQDECFPQGVVRVALGPSEILGPQSQGAVGRFRCRHFQLIFTLWVWKFRLWKLYLFTMHHLSLFLLIHFNNVQVPGLTVLLHQVVTSLISGNGFHPDDLIHFHSNGVCIHFFHLHLRKASFWLL